VGNKRTQIPNSFLGCYKIFGYSVIVGCVGESLEPYIKSHDQVWSKDEESEIFSDLVTIKENSALPGKHKLD
jgi:hypothetical protein